MEESYSVPKRKKRKTRRCLNEMRKKSRRITNVTTKNIELASKINNKTSVVESYSNSNCITSNRLTLAIFPKAVRSETITRPLLAEIRHEPGNINLNNIVRNKFTINPEASSAVNENLEDLHSINGNNNGTHVFTDEESDESVKTGVEEDAVVFRTESLSEEADSSAAGAAAPASASPSPAPHSPRSRDLYAYRMYEQFVKNIPKYIQTHAPSLLAGDAMKKPKAILHNMYLEGRRRLREAEPPPRLQPLVENPRDYLALWGACSSPATCSPSPSPSQSPSSPTSPPPTHSIIRDTPEYTYFPHKLNQ